MMKVLTFVDWYLPGFKAGGPVRTVANTIELLQSDCEFYVITRDRDLGDSQPYSGIDTDEWTKVGGAKVCYTADISMPHLRRRIREIQPDVLHLGSFFSRLTINVLLLRRLGIIPPCPVVIAPRGEFSPAALNIKRLRKKFFMKCALPTLYNGVLWHGSTEQERAQIIEVLSRYGNRETPQVAVARDIHVLPHNGHAQRRPATKNPGRLRLVFLSRISRMKNLKYAIEACSGLQGDVTFDIYGPLEQKAYFEECKRAIENVPPGVRIAYRGPVTPDRVQSTMADYHFMVLPTLGENFGHVVLEALGAGCPAVISDQTPWSDLESMGIGWNLTLDDQQRWTSVLQSCVDMDDATFVGISQRARAFAREASELPAIREENINLFRQALAVPAAIISGDGDRDARMAKEKGRA